MAIKKKIAIIGIIIATIVIPIGFYTVSPLFLSKTVNDPAPSLGQMNSGVQNESLTQFEQFMSMSDQEQVEKGQLMSTAEKDAIMKSAATTSGVTVNEEMTQDMSSNQASIIYSGVFVGANDGIHNAGGNVRIINLADGSSSVLRLEDFESTNGPDLYVYLSTDKGNSDFVNLGRLKGNIGNQNYEIPKGIHLSNYDTVLIWCKAFSVLFGSAELKKIS